MITLLIATRNLHKVGEIRAILGSGYSYQTLNDFANPPVVTEDAGTFAGNAIKKAVGLAQWLATFPARLSDPPKAQVAASKERNDSVAGSYFVLADDSGLEVDCLQGAPGVHSARFAALDVGQADNSTAEANNAKLMRLLAGVPLKQRTARFRCVLALAPVLECASPMASPVCYADEMELRTELFEGTCEGRIGFESRGEGGFGYDPLFVPDGYEQTFAELGEEEKNRLSHRAKALAKLSQRLAAIA
jgi:XTP/dITP diphosphohydrolase